MTRETQQQHTLTALVDTRAEAARAVEQLVEAGITRAEIQIIPGEGAASYTRPTGQSSYDRERDQGGFWASLKHLFLPSQDRYAYAEGMSRGGVVLSVRVDPDELERASAILERNGSVDMEQREAAWRREGWAGYQAGGSADATPATTGARGEQVIPVVEEQLRVGKRQVIKGRVRVRAYVVEVPVTAEVQLREEHVRVERHPVGRTLTPEEEARLLRERTIEAEERVEVPVVEKVPVVKEEIVIHREAGERVEVVQDTVRRTEVEVEDERGTSSGAGSAR
ncbi:MULTISPECIES: DUF2382 domain-containing protein [Methylobacterium]|uniref:DUF2382 domain-containing protein n=1 Tax=Methylobacterium TaxID=407 RepID=UPI00272ED3F9|nr:DUF2382 domain-containing protein [Methylobacterium sp.]